MKVFLFDLLPYDANLNHLKNGGTELPYPMLAEYFDSEVARHTYADHLYAWEEMDRLGYDGVAFNEHHTSPYGLMNSPNLLAAAATQRTSQLKLLIYGNLSPLHEPLRLAEELAMLDLMSNGRIISGFARGVPREYKVHNVPLSESRDRFEESYEIIKGLWTQDSFSYDGKFWQYKDVGLWPRPLQKPHPPIWMPVTSSRESIEFAGRNGIPITPGAVTPGLREDVLTLYKKLLEENGHQMSTDMVSIQSTAYVADSRAEAVREAGPHHLYFFNTLFGHGSQTEAEQNRSAGYVGSSSTDYVRPENRRETLGLRSDFRGMTMDDIARQAEVLPWGTPDEVTEKCIALADSAGANTIMLNLNRGDMPNEMFMNQIRRFAKDVLPALHAHEVKPWQPSEAAVAHMEALAPVS